jgi:hypothetical protein
MKKSLTLTMLAIAMSVAISTASLAQLSESFSDGNFSEDPVWLGNTMDWMVNADNQLQSNSTTANTSFYLSTENNLARQTQWEFYLRLAFSTSGTNYVDVWLTASSSNLLLTNTTGYFVRIGNTADEISLYRKDANLPAIKIIDGIDGSVGNNNNSVRIKVTRDADNQWILYRDLSGTGNAFVAEGSVKDETFLTSSYFGVLVKQSTTGFFQKHFLDDIEISAFMPDIIPPNVVSATAVFENTLTLVFNEPVSISTAQTISNYTVNNSIGQPVTATVSDSDPTRVSLVFANYFTERSTYELRVNNLKDLAGNELKNNITRFIFYIPRQYDIVITEIMADPTPAVGLPEAEWIELKNTCPVSINLQGYKVGRVGSLSGAIPALTLAPDSSVIICPASQVSALSAYGYTVGVTSFPSLANDGDLLIVQTPNGSTMHAVQYSNEWYKNAVKSNGGWSLEMIDTRNPCAGISNWKASVDTKGGSPGRVNSVDAINRDVTAPNLLRAYAKDSQNLLLYFDEPMDSVSATLASNYVISDGVGAAEVAVPQAPLFNTVNISLSNVLAPGKTYTITVMELTDCSGNSVDASATVVGLSSLADSFDIVVNEVLFDPKPMGVDYIELYNRSNKIIDLSTVYMANRSGTSGAMGTPLQLSSENRLLFPNEFVVLTTDPTIVQNLYTVKNHSAMLQMLSLPSFPDDKGTAVLLNNTGQIIDELNYSYKWHFALVDDAEGIALERIDYSKPTNDAANWTSAASSAGFGTPTFQNSQFRSELMPQGEITITPKVFSPDNDGYDDYAFIEFKFPEPGYVINIAIFDAIGRPVRVLQRNTTAGSSGSFRWDGLNDKQQIVPAGTYIIFTDIFNLKGQKKSFKSTAIVAKKW